MPFFIVWTTGTVGAVSIGLETTGTVQAAQAPGFGPKLQVGGSVALALLVPLFSYLSFATSLEAFGVLPSDTSGGFVYRGFGGLALGASFEGLFPVARSRRDGTLSLGVSGGAAAVLPAYTGTTLYFFYPDIRTSLVLSWQPAAPAFAFRIEIPVRFQLRRDLTFSGSAGLGVDVFYYLGGPR